MSSQPARPRPSRDDMAVPFTEVERVDAGRTGSAVTLSQLDSAAPTLNNTPSGSRSPSPVRKKAPSRSPTPLPEQVDLKVTDSKQRLIAVSSHCDQELALAWMGSIVITCFFTSGLIDAVAFNSWSCFVGMQTGNTVFAALGLIQLPSQAHDQQFLKSIVAIGSFCIGTVFFNILHRFPTALHKTPTSRKRVIFVLSFLVQASLIATAAALITAGLVSNRPFEIGQFSSGSDTTGDVDRSHRNYADFLPIIILAFEAAGQVCLSRVLSLVELPTIVLSTLFHDWTGDLLGTKQLWRQSSGIQDFIMIQGRRQNKRLLAIIALFVGALSGGELYKSKVGMAGALWLASFLKGSIFVAFVFWKKEKAGDEESGR